MLRLKSFPSGLRVYPIGLIVLGIFGCFPTPAKADEKASARIVIVGAGSAGIATASKLFEAGFNNITILEAEDRIGGRVHTTLLEGDWVDLGAQWVHGQKNNIAYELAAPLGLVENNTGHWGYYDVYDSSGQLLDRNLTQTLLDAFIYEIDNIDKVQGKNSSVGTYMEEKFEEYFQSRTDVNATLKKQLLEILNLMYIPLESADDWHDIAMEEYSVYDNCEGDHMTNWKNRGYSTILDVLMKKLPNPSEELPIMNNTILSSEVQSINYNDKDNIKIQTIDGKEYLADHVVVTPSLGVLKAQYETLFDPPLPESKINSIKGLAYGTATKILISYKEPWWPVDRVIKGFIPLWNEEDKKLIQDDPLKKWMLNTTAFMNPAYRPRVMEGWISGEGARSLENIPDDVIFNTTVQMIQKFLGTHHNVSEAVKMLRSKWYTNKHFRGTYTYHSLDTQSSGASSKELAEPIIKDGKPVLLFAGEATNEHHFSTVNGAIETGFREAKRIIDYYSKP